MAIKSLFLKCCALLFFRIVNFLSYLFRLLFSHLLLGIAKKKKISDIVFFKLGFD